MKAGIKDKLENNNSEDCIQYYDEKNFSYELFANVIKQISDSIVEEYKEQPKRMKKLNDMLIKPNEEVIDKYKFNKYGK